MMDKAEIKQQFDKVEKQADNPDRINKSQTTSLLKKIGFNQIYQGKVISKLRDILGKDIHKDPYLNFDQFYILYQCFSNPIIDIKYQILNFKKIILEEVKQSQTSDLELLDRGIKSSVKLLFGKKQQYRNKIQLFLNKTEKKYIKPTTQIVLKLKCKQSSQELKEFIENMIKFLIEVFPHPMVQKIYQNLKFDYQCLDKVLITTIKVENMQEIQEVVDLVSTLIDEATLNTWNLDFHLLIQSVQKFSELLNPSSQDLIHQLVTHNSSILVEAQANQAYSVIKQILKSTTFFSGLQVSKSSKTDISILGLLFSEALHLELQMDNFELSEEQAISKEYLMTTLNQLAVALNQMKLGKLMKLIEDQIHINAKFGVYTADLTINIQGLIECMAQICEQVNQNPDSD